MSVVAVAVIGTAVIGGVVASNSADKAQASADNATAAQSAAAAEGTAVAQQRLDFEKQQWAEGKTARETAATTANQVSAAQLEAQKQATDLAAEYDAYRKTTFQPLEQQIVKEATAYDTPDRRTAAATAATADVDTGFARSNDAMNRRIASMGVNPGSSRSIAAMGGSAVEQAKASAGAAYMARKGVEDTGTAMKTNAVSLGRNLPANQNASANTAVAAGNSAVNNSTVPVGVNQTPNSLSSAYAGLSSAYGGQASAFGQQASTYANISNAGNAAWGQLGSVAGQIGTKYLTSTTPASTSPTNAQLEQIWAPSDENVKTDITGASDEEALEAVGATPVKKWRYDPAKMAAAGIPMDDGAEHTGPMAQDVNKTMGERVAPGGKKLDLVTMNGVNMKATQALNKKVDRLAKQVSTIASRVRSGNLEARAA